MKKIWKGVDPGRRQALGMLTAAAAISTIDPVRTLIEGIVNGLTNKAQATGNQEPRNYLYIAFPFGPPRYSWDLPLCPYSELNNPNYVYPSSTLNRAIANKFKNPTGLELEYGTSVVTAPLSKIRLRMPYLWSQTIPTVGGSWVPMVNLLDNMIFIRGIASLDGHGDSQLIQLRPKPGSPSVDGAVTDQSHRAVPSLSLPGAPDIYASAKGIGNVRIYNTTVADSPLSAILSPFDRPSTELDAGYLSRRQAMDVAISKAMDALGAAARARNPGAENLWSSRSIAENMIRKGLGDVGAEYETLFNKYTGLIRACIPAFSQGQIPFITDRALPSSYIPGSYVSTLQEVLIPTNSTLINLAESLAIAEYLFIHGYSSAITAGCTGIGNVAVVGTASYAWDEHFTPAIGSMAMNHFAWKAVAACMYEFTQQLKAHGLFEETVIHLGAEFSRSPRNDFTGSDHSSDGSAISIISGAIRQPYVIGDTRPSDEPNTSGMHTGNFGVGTPMQLDGGLRQPTVGNQASTLAHILRVKSPSPNDASMLFDGGSGIVPSVDLAKNKGES